MARDGAGHGARHSGPAVLVVANDVPVPPNNGGRVDVWRRLNLLKALDVRTALLCWSDASCRLDSGSRAAEAVGRACDTAMQVPITRSAGELAGRLLQLWRLPSHAASRWVTVDRAALLQWARVFRPTTILLDGLYGAACARWLAASLHLPLLYRSHNIEHLYMRRQLARVRSWRRQFRVWVNLLGLERLERSVVAQAYRVLDISLDDQQYWHEQGFDHVDWLPPLVDAEFTASLNQPDTPQWDILYFGNLNTPNNVDAVRWLVDSVLPLVPGDGLTVAVAGSRPTPEVGALLGRDRRVTLIRDPEDMAAVVRRARVLANPVRAGSGVNIKSIEMLFSRAPLVSTSFGVRGLPVDARACFAVHDDAPGFAGALRRGLAGVGQPAGVHGRQAACRAFTADEVASRLQKVLATIPSHPERGSHSHEA